MPISSRATPDPFIGVREAAIAPLLVEHEDFDYSHCFLTHKKAAEVIKQGTL